MRVLISDKIAPEGIEILKREGLEVVDKQPSSPEELLSLIKDVEAVIVRSTTKITAEVIQQARKLKVIGRAGVGLDNVDVDAASRKGIIVMNAPGGNTISTSEHTWALIFSLMRNIPQAQESLLRGEWRRSRFMGSEIYGKTLGIIGLGRIGREVARRAVPLGMKVIVYDPFISEEIAKKLDARLVELDILLKEADIITIHAPLTEETRNLLSHREFSLMKEGARIVNCARGGIIDEEALYKALEEGRIGGCALDVFANEPPSRDFKLFKFRDRCIFTPHLGASTEEAQIGVAQEVARCVCDALKNRGIRNAINFPSLDTALLETLGPYIELGEKMGLFASQLTEGRTQKIKIGIWGNLSEYEYQPLVLSLLKGFFMPIVEENVNYVNAPQIARERNIEVKVISSLKEEEFVNAVSLEVRTDKERRFLVGTLFAKNKPRIVKIDEFYVELIPQGWILILSNLDKPGVIGNIGSLLGKRNINIANMTFGRKSPGGEAITILNLDDSIPAEVLEEVKSLKYIIDAWLIKL